MEYKYNFNMIASMADFMFNFNVLRFSKLEVQSSQHTHQQKLH